MPANERPDERVAPVPGLPEDVDVVGVELPRSAGEVFEDADGSVHATLQAHEIGLLAKRTQKEIAHVDREELKRRKDGSSAMVMIDGCHKQIKRQNRTRGGM